MPRNRWTGLDGALAPMLKKHKYLVPRDLTVGQFIYLIRKNLKIKARTSHFYVHKRNYTSL